MRQAVPMVVRQDRVGDGRYEAPRGDKKHRGMDFVCLPGGSVLSPVNGKITRNGYAYGDDLRWEYIEITDAAGFRHRLFYVAHNFRKGKHVHRDMLIGKAQDITQRYPRRGMKPHVHYEVIAPDGEYTNPEVFT